MTVRLQKLTAEEIEDLRRMARETTPRDLLEMLKERKEPIVCSEVALQKFFRRAAHASIVAHIEEGEETRELYRSLCAEKAEERKLKVMEENAKLGFRKLESENAEASLKLLPVIQGILMDAPITTDDRVQQALAVLRKEGGRLLSTGPAAHEGIPARA